MKTDAQIVADCNALARVFYQMQGCIVPDGFLFYAAHHPQERGCWNMAVVAYEHIEGTDVESVLGGMVD